MRENALVVMTASENIAEIRGAKEKVGIAEKFEVANRQLRTSKKQSRIDKRKLSSAVSKLKESELKYNILFETSRDMNLLIEQQREEILHVTRVGKLAEFVSSLAHEIRQPLTAILSYAQAAKRMIGEKDPEFSEILSYIISDDQRAAEVVQRIRALLKKNKIEMKPLEINSLVNETAVLVANDATVRNNSIKLKLKNDLPLVNGDRVQLQQVLINLISNSFEAMGNNKEGHEISIRTARKDKKTILVAVRDTGTGISEQNCPKLFTRFFTSKPDGLGMGLSISRAIIESHGGCLEGKNNPGCGATFCFTLPVGKTCGNNRI